MSYQALKGLKIEDYMYPGEDNALNLVRKIPVIKDLLSVMNNMTFQVQTLPELHGSFYRVTEKTCPHLDKLFQEAKERLDIHKDIPLFVEPKFEYNAYTTGTTNPIVCITSAFVKSCSDDTLRFVLGHELGHIKSEHLVYDMLASSLVQLSQEIPVVGGLITPALVVALYSWFRMHEFTCDRAGAIAVGSVDKAMIAVQALLGVNEKIEGVHVTADDLMAQNEMYREEEQNVITKAFMFMNIVTSTHPWTIDRIRELNKWDESGEFDMLVERLG